MKKTLTLLALLLSVSFFAQTEIKEGVITFSQKMSSPDEQVKAQLAMLGDMTSVTYFKGSKSRSEISNPMSGKIININDVKTNEALMLMDNPMLGKKYKFQTSTEISKQLENADITKGDKTKTVLGYECQQYLVKAQQEGVEMSMEMYLTEAIVAASQHGSILGEKVKGFPLYIETKMNQMGMEMIIYTEATEIKKEAVSDDLFSLTPPEGYEKL
ncbi:DUF4412 domain-containing protein [Seonamhaeicola marinus]|uniref:DUF4412 domain-containing protein n=1 Tax=Seonamhaeicola marinus TaxID=1912246 RepID=A0A5D0IKG5_9FLAO|nr:DUF4412 domain-containing protein [Seonamhaeicola marinus]TYA84393.1 DUF4412 domain-containing protein [Seonamhaeicola marinus]